MTDIKLNPDMDATIDRQFADPDPGDWVGVFENHDLGHSNIGMRFGLIYGADQDEKATIGKTHAPDTSFGPGWRYLLVAKCYTADETKEAMA